MIEEIPRAPYEIARKRQAVFREQLIWRLAAQEGSSLQEAADSVDPWVIDRVAQSRWDGTAWIPDYGNITYEPHPLWWDKDELGRPEEFDTYDKAVTYVLNRGGILLENSDM